MLDYTNGHYNNHQLAIHRNNYTHGDRKQYIVVVVVTHHFLFVWTKFYSNPEK